MLIILTCGGILHNYRIRAASISYWYDHFLCAWYKAEHFTCVLSWNPDPERKVLWISVFYRWKNKDTDLFTDTQLINSKSKIWMQNWFPSACLWNVAQYHFFKVMPTFWSFSCTCGIKQQRKKKKKQRSPHPSPDFAPGGTMQCFTSPLYFLEQRRESW